MKCAGDGVADGATLLTMPTTGASAAWAQEWIARRQTILPKRLGPPGPDEAQQQALLRAAAAAPDHGQLVPWRFIDIPATARAALGEIFVRALSERDPSATPQQLQQAREKARRAPLLWLLVVNANPALTTEASVPVRERILSAGCAVQNVLLLATAMGYGSALTSGKALDATLLRDAFALNEYELPVCFLSIGTVTQARPVRSRPEPARFYSVWTPPAGLEITE